MAKKLFGNRIEPACEYCNHGTPSSDGKMILCEKKGITAPFYSCKKFDYNPLKREPRPAPVLPQYRQEDFAL